MKKLIRVYSGWAAFFVMTASSAAVAVGVFVPVLNATGSSAYAVVAMFAALLPVTSLFFAIGNARRKRTVDVPVSVILAAAERLSRGDFSVMIDLGRESGDNRAFALIAEHFNRMAEELAATEILHTDFVADVSHEIKTPLAIIRNCAQALNLPSLSEEEKSRYLSMMTSAADRLSGLASNVLKLNKLERRELLVKAEPFDLSAALADCIVAIEDEAEKKGLTIECDLPDGAQIVSDKDLLDTVWSNLLGNAVKFTDSGKVSVSLVVTPLTATVTVSDTGCGMSEETGRRIFDKFWQGDTSHSSEGNGLGLALVRKIIDIVGGKIDVNSAPGKGSVFSVTLHRGLNDVAQDN